jgi:hypothetical protein
MEERFATLGAEACVLTLALLLALARFLGAAGARVFAILQSLHVKIDALCAYTHATCSSRLNKFVLMHARRSDSRLMITHCDLPRNLRMKHITSCACT